MATTTTSPTAKTAVTGKTCPTSTISTRGQLTIPKEIRDAFDLREGDKVEFRREDGKLVLVRCLSGENPFLKFAGIGPPVPGGSVAWVRRLRGHAADEFDE